MRKKKESEFTIMCSKFLHAFECTMEEWRDYGYVDAMKDDYRLILIDARGHGGSDKPHDVEAYDLKPRSADVVAVLDDIGVDKPHFWGYRRYRGATGAGRARGPGPHTGQRLGSARRRSGALTRAEASRAQAADYGSLSRPLKKIFRTPSLAIPSLLVSTPCRSIRNVVGRLMTR